QPSWVIQSSFPNGPSGAFIASISEGPGQVAVLIDGSPPHLIEFAESGASEHPIDIGAALPASLRLYLDETSKLAAFGISSGATPEIVTLSDQSGTLVAASTGVTLDATEYATAGGPDGAAVWMRRSDGWWRAQPTTGTWSVDKGPITDPEPSEPLHASGATSDGSLYIAYGVDTSFGFDDTETPYLKRLPPSGSSFDSAVVAGGATDDYLTSLSLEGRGRGLVVHYCGSDIDPFGLSGTDYTCFTGLRPSDGDTYESAPKEGVKARHALSKTSALVSACLDDNALNLRDTTASDTDPGENVVFTCREPVALEIDSDDRPIFVVREGLLLQSLVRRATQ
ncbi:MAG TPA: hypothetical protein VGP93_14795, partial [Polyangiaceae bacterium]|nr:hypothetical protein [Polyangiaceae bacterium]